VTSSRQVLGRWSSGLRGFQRSPKVVTRASTRPTTIGRASRDVDRCRPNQRRWHRPARPTHQGSGARSHHSQLRPNNTGRARRVQAVPAPRAATHTALNGLLTEYGMTRASRAHRPADKVVRPPHRSTTKCPSCQIATADPARPAATTSTNTSLTRRNRESHRPSTIGTNGSLPRYQSPRPNRPPRDPLAPPTTTGRPSAGRRSPQDRDGEPAGCRCSAHAAARAQLITIAGFESSHLDLRKAEVGLPMSSQPVARRTRHLSASAGPLGPPQGIGRPPQANRATVTGGDLDRQRPWSPAVRATQLDGYLAPPEVTMPTHIDPAHPLAQVRDLARDLGVSCTQILQIASALGLPVSCPSSVITAGRAEQIANAYRRTESLSRVPAPR
jgi:hypothetical protein